MSSNGIGSLGNQSPSASPQTGRRSPAAFIRPQSAQFGAQYPAVSNSESSNKTMTTVLVSAFGLIVDTFGPERVICYSGSAGHYILQVLDGTVAFASASLTCIGDPNFTGGLSVIAFKDKGRSDTIIVEVRTSNGILEAHDCVVTIFCTNLYSFGVSTPLSPSGNSLGHTATSAELDTGREFHLVASSSAVPIERSDSPTMKTDARSSDHRIESRTESRSDGRCVDATSPNIPRRLRSNLSNATVPRSISNAASTTPSSAASRELSPLGSRNRTFSSDRVLGAFAKHYP